MNDNLLYYKLKSYGNRRVIDIVRDVLLSDTRLKFDNTNEDDKWVFMGLEVYIIKYYDNPESLNLKVKMDERIDRLFKVYSKNPFIMSDSIILSSSSLCTKFSSNNKDRLDNYSNGNKTIFNNWESVYNNYINDISVSDYDLANLMTFFIRKINFKPTSDKDKMINSCIEKLIYKIIQKNEIPNNKYVMLLLMNYASKYTLNYYNFPNESCVIRMADLDSGSFSFLGGYENNGYIFLNSSINKNPSFYHSLDQIIQTCCHETAHRVQELEASKNPQSVHGLEMALQQIFAYKDYKVGNNYIFSEIEFDADYRGYWASGLIYRHFDRSDISSKLTDEKIIKFKRKRLELEHVIVLDNGVKKVFTKEEYNVKNIRRAVKDNLSLLKKYPSLNNIFTSKGNPKSLEEMLTEEFISHDINSIYNDFFLYDIMHGELNNIDFSSYSPVVLERMLHKITSLIKMEETHLIRIMDDEEYRKNSDCSKLVYNSFNNHLKKFIMMSEVVDKYLTFTRKYERANNNSHKVFSAYTCSVRNLMDHIDKIKDKSSIEPSLNNYSSKLQSLDVNIKKDYIQYLIEHFTDEELNSYVRVGSNDILLKDYIYNIIFKHLDRNHYLRDNHGRIVNQDNGKYIFPIDYIRNVVKNSKDYYYIINNDDLCDMFIEDSSKKNVDLISTKK